MYLHKAYTYPTCYTASHVFINTVFTSPDTKNAKQIGNDNTVLQIIVKLIIIIIVKLIIVKFFHSHSQIDNHSEILSTTQNDRGPYVHIISCVVSQLWQCQYYRPENLKIKLTICGNIILVK